MSKRKSAFPKTVANHMASLPSDYLWQYASTQDLMTEWLHLRNNAIFFGKCLKARFGGGGGNPALQEKIDGRIDETEYALVMAAVAWYESIFNLVQSGWEYIEQELSGALDDYPATETEMYLEILTEIYNAKFQQRVNGFIAPANQGEQNMRLIRDLIRRGTPLLSNPSDVIVDADSQNLSALAQMSDKQPDQTNTFWFSLVTGICFEKSKSDDSLKRLSRDFFKKMEVLLDLLAISLRQERSKKTPNRFPSIRWKDGDKYEGVKGGWKRLVT